MKKPFGRDKSSKKDEESDNEDKSAKKDEKSHDKDKPVKADKKMPRPKKDTSLTDADYQRKKLFKKGLNLMADEKLDDAAHVFEQALRFDPDSVETLIKLGYVKFHLNDHIDALKVYDRILEIDITNAEAWHLKSLVHYAQKNYSKALDAVEKALDSDPTFALAWYNKGCYLSLLMQIPEAIEALKRSIEIDVKNARNAVKELDFVNVRAEDGFRRIIEVVVLESVRQGYHTIGSIVWTTFLDKADAEDALLKLLEKGLIVKHEKREGLHRIPVYDLVPEIATKVGTEKKNLLGIRRKKLPGAVKNLKELSETIQDIKRAIDDEDIDKMTAGFDDLIDSKKYGEQMIEQFFEEHREIRLWKIRLKDHGVEFLQDNKKKMQDVFDNIETAVTKQLRGKIT